MNQAELRQTRLGITKLINQNKTTIVINRLPLKDNGLGEMLPDPYGTPVDYYVRCRISGEKKYPSTLTPVITGFSEDQQLYILCDFTQGIFRGDYFTYYDNEYEIGPINRIVFLGKTVCYEAPLKLVQPKAVSST